MRGILNRLGIFWGKLLLYKVNTLTQKLLYANIYTKLN